MNQVRTVSQTTRKSRVIIVCDRKMDHCRKYSNFCFESNKFGQRGGEGHYLFHFSAVFREGVFLRHYPEKSMYRKEVYLEELNNHSMEAFCTPSK
ncbi:MAG: hypothetical protein JWM56_103 [Candidatus Peribacteria bacterium]|nr:hypothetical protein [Candidatus Peribacteria bacterium]